MSAQHTPAALVHAEWLEKSLTIGAPEAGAELRRLHTERNDLLAALKDMVAGDAEAIEEAEALGVPFPEEMLGPYRRAVAAIAKAEAK